jgi:hypothetical protein
MKSDTCGDSLENEEVVDSRIESHCENAIFSLERGVAKRPVHTCRPLRSLPVFIVVRQHIRVIMRGCRPMGICQQTYSNKCGIPLSSKVCYLCPQTPLGITNFSWRQWLSVTRHVIKFGSGSRFEIFCGDHRTCGLYTTLIKQFHAFWAPSEPWTCLSWSDFELVTEVTTDYVITLQIKQCTWVDALCVHPSPLDNHSMLLNLITPCSVWLHVQLNLHILCKSLVSLLFSSLKIML